MNNLRHIAITAVLATSCVSAFFSTVLADDSYAPVGTGETFYIPALPIPPSDFWSPEFNEHAKTVTPSRLHPRLPFLLQTPPRNASKAEWDKFDADSDRVIAGYLALALERYPVSVVDTRIAGVRVGIIWPKDGVASKNQRRVLIHLRGGGFVQFRGLSFGQLESVPIASTGRIKVITVDYRQAPYYTYPAASEDVEAVYKEMLKQYKPEAIGIFGCSAGGKLTAQAVAWLQWKGLPRPGAVGIFCSAPPGQRQGGDSSVLWSPEPGAPFPTSGYMEAADVNDPKAYPGCSDAVLARFPATLFLTGTRSYEMSATVVAHARFLKLGVDSSLYVIEGAWHAAHLMAIGTIEAHDANVYIAHWFDQHLAR